MRRAVHTHHLVDNSLTPLAQHILAKHHYVMRMQKSVEHAVAQDNKPLRDARRLKLQFAEAKLIKLLQN